eukprot:5658907-Prymnesium_polylepis.1
MRGFGQSSTQPAYERLAIGPSSGAARGYSVVWGRGLHAPTERGVAAASPTRPPSDGTATVGARAARSRGGGATPRSRGGATPRSRGEPHRGHVAAD